MREILFKAKRLYNGEWVEGYLFFIADIPHIICDGKEICMNRKNADLYDTELYEVDKNTICQYTGLTDKNGNKIWENDVVRCYAIDIADREYEFVSDVFWDDCMWMLHEKECCDNMLCHFDMTKNWVSHIPEIEVIGNIFDNADLLQ